FVYELARRDPDFWHYDDEFVPTHYGPAIGLIQRPDGREPSGGWEWDSGESLGYRNWGRSQPDDFQNREDFVHLWIQGKRYTESPDLPNGPTWNDMRNISAPLVFELEN
ncbi:MAG TPA: hypothetical protein VLA12_10715, partial [Planctomycetaceae bacterium]|nr:hypothetical protein [Planctomycetaceae bacterium]